MARLLSLAPRLVKTNIVFIKFMFYQAENRL